MKKNSSRSLVGLSTLLKHNCTSRCLFELPHDDDSRRRCQLVRQECGRVQGLHGLQILGPSTRCRAVGGKMRVSLEGFQGFPRPVGRAS